MTKEGKDRFLRFLYSWEKLKEMDTISIRQNWLQFFENEDDDVMDQAMKAYKMSSPMPPQVSEISGIINSIKKRKVEAQNFEQLAHDAPCQKCLGRGCWMEWWHDEWQTLPDKRKKHIVYKLDEPPIETGTGRLLDDYAAESMVPCDCERGRFLYAGVFRELERQKEKKERDEWKRNMSKSSQGNTRTASP